MTTAADYRQALRYAESTLTVGDPAKITHTLLGGLAALVGADTATLTHVELTGAREVALFWPQPDTDRLRRYAAVATEHPLRTPVLQRVRSRDRDAPPVRISDVMTIREWRSSAIYAASHHGIDDQMSLPLTAKGTAVRAVTLSRFRGAFTDRQRELLSVSRAHLRAALRRIEPGRFLGLQLAPEPGWTPLASAPGMADLPAVAPATQMPDAASCPDLSLLSEREREVAALVAGGRTDSQIARQLGLRPATVSSHLRRVYARVGLANRAELAAAWIAQHPARGTQA